MKKQDEYIVSTSKNIILASSSSSENESNADDNLPRYDGRYFIKVTKSKTTHSYQRRSLRGHLLMSLASKPQVLENCPVLGSRTAVFFKLLKFCRSREKNF